MKPWTAWVHFHRKYSTYRHKLNHAQPAGARGVWTVHGGTGPWIFLSLNYFSMILMVFDCLHWGSVRCPCSWAGGSCMTPRRICSWRGTRSSAGCSSHAAPCCTTARSLQHVQAVTTCAVILQHVQSFATYSVICTTCSVPYNMSSHLKHVQSFATCAVIYNMSRQLRHVQPFTTCPVIYDNMFCQHVQSLTICAVIYNMYSHLKHVQSFAACPVI
jgi:hypothetical protein